MSWRERWEAFKENLVHTHGDEKLHEEEKRVASAEPRTQPGHRPDESSGSETLDD